VKASLTACGEIAHVEICRLVAVKLRWMVRTMGESPVILMEDS
jgi:hypothetical protein